MYQNETSQIEKRSLINSRIFIFGVGMFLFVSVNILNHYLSDTKKVTGKYQETLNPYIFKSTINNAIKKENGWPATIELPGQKVTLEYSFDKKLTEYIKKIIQAYRPEYSSVVVIDNNTGKILSAVGYSRSTNMFNNSMPFSSTHPSASIFKIITAATLLKSNRIDNDTMFSYRGKGTTLYRYQLDGRIDRWTRNISFERAFASSNNVVFAKAAAGNISSEDLYQMAYSLGFNQSLMDDIEISKSVFPLPIDSYNLAESSAGFNTSTTTSPIHVAMLASIMANDGIMKYPTIINQAIDAKSGEDIKLYERPAVRVLDANIAKALKQMMRETINVGTARGSFRQMRQTIKEHLSIGGKTGSITGGTPFGKRDWFTGYAMPIQSRNKGISVSVMNINVTKWYVRSAYLAQSIIEHYYKVLNNNLIDINEYAYEKNN